MAFEGDERPSLFTRILIWMHFREARTAQRRPRIDRSMIGEPMNFQHTGHIGSGEVQISGISVDLNDMSYRMKSKGGYQDNGVDSRLTPNGDDIGNGMKTAQE
ncbi:CDC42 small effector protein homolog isoform X2 [Xenia sp. Carnegie-2017]|uniref:CDC42 small effector protein homolog isoform X2 n=1 Tax=Xenia sp. Carnegie-2017 TaxID=2897299 RepID=UPI001F03970B|nr:CDC42 small effector protein homolog isoform X2 [Xenia sp. Carnegie-2017]